MGAEIYTSAYVLCVLYHEARLLENILVVKLVCITVLCVLLIYKQDDGFQYIHRPPEP